MKHPVLLDVLKDSPTRKEKLDAFKAKHDIWTHCASHMNEKWCAMAVTLSIQRLFGYSDLKPDESVKPIDLIARYCRLLDEANLLVNGNTEAEAVRSLCEFNNIPCDL